MLAKLLDLSPTVFLVALTVLVVLAALRVRLNEEVQKATERDEGRYWQSLPWEARNRYLRRLSVVSWAFAVIFLATLAFGAWCAYYGWHRPGL